MVQLLKIGETHGAATMRSLTKEVILAKFLWQLTMRLVDHLDELVVAILRLL